MFSRPTVVRVHRTDDIAAFLASRHAHVTPKRAGLDVTGKRRLPGRRREAVAPLAGVSIDDDKRLDRGNLTGVSDSVLEALAQALRVDDAEARASVRPRRLDQQPASPNA